uniref:Transglycosylase SLT domain-containing protein n=1 Tax=viral metagenome TaxID=1070528 RepID=A0A6M3KCL7_9ZZZZ
MIIINMKFKINKKIEPIKKKRKWLPTKIALILLLLALSAYGIKQFINQHEFRTPVVFQNPVPLKEMKLLNPVGTASAEMIVIPNPYNEKSPKGIAWVINKDMFGVQHWGALEELITRESHWNPYAINSSSRACGLGQALPCSKMKCELWDYDCQVKWVLKYIDNRYGNPTEALNYHNLKNWY